MDYYISAEKGISDYYYCSKVTNASNISAIHSHIEFIFILKGELVVTVDKNTHTVTAGNSVVVMPYQVHSYVTENFSEVFFIACPPDYINEHKKTLTKKLFVPPVANFGNGTNILIDEILSSEFKDDFKKKALLYYTLSHFMKSCALTDRETVEFDVYRKAIAYISEHYTENITLETVADSVGVTAPHLSRVLNGGCKSSFSDIINALRIYEAKKLLEQTTLSISEVAYASGYGSIRNFNRIFVKYFHCNPKDIRKK
ncbi:MAG: AraC family transcriptional regulator [Clostridia bacterium]|nr:AraC family transcriptional regulator [Clostridia bacterium]